MFIKVDTQAAVDIGDLEKYSVALKVVRPRFNVEIFPSVIIREGVGEMTLWEGEEGALRSCINTTNVGDS